MVNVNRLKAVLKEQHIPLEQVAKTIGVNPSTLYRRFNQKNVYFSVNEVDKLATLLNLDFNAVQDIFFDGSFA